MKLFNLLVVIALVTCVSIPAFAGVSTTVVTKHRHTHIRKQCNPRVAFRSTTKIKSVCSCGSSGCSFGK